MLNTLLQMALQIVIVLTGSWFFLLFVKLAYKFLRADKLLYRQLHEAGTLEDALKGTIIPREGFPAHRIREGLAIDKKKNKVVPQGTLSDDALNSLLQ